MDDRPYGTRDKRGTWAPGKALEIAPVWTGNWSALTLWLIGYFWPHYTVFMAVTLACWYFVLPDWEAMKTFSWGWILWLHVLNPGGIFLLFGAVELFYYVRRKQATRFKYNHRLPSEHPSDVFWFKSQTIDTFLRTFFVSIPPWTLIQSVTLWCFANSDSLWRSPDRLVGGRTSCTPWLWATISPC